jgi:hypothetical protein
VDTTFTKNAVLLLIVKNLDLVDYFVINSIFVNRKLLTDLGERCTLFAVREQCSF